MKKIVIAAAVLSAFAAYAGAPAKKQVQTPADSLSWSYPYGEQGPGVAMVSGADKKNGPSQMFMKMKAGFDSGWHTHDADYDGVVVKGTVQNVEQGGEADAKPMPQGSWWHQPGKVNHHTSCGADSDCIIFLNLPKGFSYNAMTADGKKAPAQAAPAKGEGKAEAKPATGKGEMKGEMKKDAAAPKK